jgi:hypothetical protein
VDLNVSQLPSPLTQLSQVRKMRQGSCTGWQIIILLSSLVTDYLHCQISVIHLADIRGGNAREAGNISLANLPLWDLLQLCLRFTILAGVIISISVCNICVLNGFFAIPVLQSLLLQSCQESFLRLLWKAVSRGGGCLRLRTIAHRRKTERK